MIVKVHVRLDRSDQHSVVGKGATMVHIGLHRLVPRLHVRVISHPARSVDAPIDVVLGQQIAIDAEILDAAITVEDRLR